MKFIIDEYARDKILKKILKKRNFDCLEIGCQYFRQTKIIKKFYNKVYCIDEFSYTNEKKKNIYFKKIDAESYEIPSNIKDIFFLGTIEHLKKPNLVLRKVAKHLKKSKGNLYLSINNKNSLHRILGYQLERLKDMNDLTKKERVHGHNFIFDEQYCDKFLQKNNFKFKKDYFLTKTLPTDILQKLFKRKDLIKLIKPKILKSYSAYIFYKASYIK